MVETDTIRFDVPRLVARRATTLEMTIEDGKNSMGVDARRRRGVNAT